MNEGDAKVIGQNVETRVPIFAAGEANCSPFAVRSTERVPDDAQDENEERSPARRLARDVRTGYHLSYQTKFVRQIEIVP